MKHWRPTMAVLVGMACWLCGGEAWAQQAGDGPELAILPFANNTGTAGVDSLYSATLHRLLDERGVTYVTAAALRPLLREHRVRSRGWIGRRGVDLVVGATGARHLLLGAWDVHRAEGNIETGLSLRILDVESGMLVAAVSEGGTGEDGVGWLDLGRIDDMGVLVEVVLARSLDGVLPIPAAPSVRRSWRGCNHVAVVPLDNQSGTVNAGRVLTNVLLSRLLDAGYAVVEPGFVREIGISREMVVKGGVDRASGRAINEALGACRVVTGAVATFEPARGLPSVSIPNLAVGLRVTVSATGRVIMMRELEGAGDDGQGLLQRGRVHALIPVANRLLDTFALELAAANREDIIHGPGHESR